MVNVSFVGQLGLQTTAMHNKPQSVARLPEGFKITSLFCGPDSTAVLSDTGQLLVCGSNRSADNHMTSHLYITL